MLQAYRLPSEATVQISNYLQQCSSVRRWMVHGVWRKDFQDRVCGHGPRNCHVSGGAMIYPAQQARLSRAEAWLSNRRNVVEEPLVETLVLFEEFLMECEAKRRSEERRVGKECRSR